MENPDDGGIVRSGNLVVTPRVTDSLLAQAYLTYEKEGTLPVIFYLKIPTIKAFIDAHMEVGPRVTLGCFRIDEGSNTPTFTGLGWVSDSVRIGKYCKAEIGIGMFRSAGKDNLAFGKMMLQCFFQQYPIDVLFGCTPDENKLALRYAQKLGFSLHGPIPQYCSWGDKLSDAWISHMSKEEWIERNRPIPL